MNRLSSAQLASVEARLSERDARILQVICELRLVRARHVEGLVFTEGSPLTRARRARSALARLHDLGLLARLDRRVGGVRAGSSGYIYRLSFGGRRLLGLRTKSGWREPGLAYVDHTLAAADLHLLLSGAVVDGQIEGFDLQHEPAAWRRFAGLAGEQQWLKPDLAVRILTADYELYWFVEIDRGTESLRRIRSKAEQYLAYWRTGAEQRRLGLFPRVLWLAPEESRAQAIRTELEQMGVPATAMHLVATDDGALVVISDGGGAP